MKFYDYEEIKRVGNCVDFAEARLQVNIDRSGRCAAVWRDGDNKTAVHIKDKEWYDHRTQEGGSIIDLCAIAMFGGDTAQAQSYLGEYYNLKPRSKREKSCNKSHYDQLIEEGYKETDRYNYTDQDGILRHFVCRMEHPEKSKQFVQGHPGGWGSKNAQYVLYNLPEIAKASWAIVVEGEKDVETLRKNGICNATTNVGGAEKWLKSYSETLAEKDVVIMRDNDDAGMKHAKTVIGAIADVVRTIKVVCPSSAEKGDVTDFFEAGGTVAELGQMMKAAPVINKADVDKIEVPRQKTLVEIQAKDANATPFSNYIATTKKVGNRSKTTKRPRQLRKIVDDFHRRFLGFPCKIGELLFDHDKDADEIRFIRNKEALFAFAAMKSGKNTDWTRGESYIAKEEFFQAIISEAHRFEGISSAPHWPTRNDVYYTYRDCPKATNDARYFQKLLDYFSPHTEQDQIGIAAMMATPLFSKQVPSPLFVIDSKVGQGTGKSVLIQVMSWLYGDDMESREPFYVDFKQINSEMNLMTVFKRLLSTSGRRKRVMLIDNVTGYFKSPQLATMITQSSISGMAPYGKGEESRPNDLTYCITANDATLDRDLVDRAMIIFLDKKWKDGERSGSWMSEVSAYISKNRLHILSDICGMLDRRELDIKRPFFRMPEWEREVLAAMCKTEEDYNKFVYQQQQYRQNADGDIEQSETLIQYIKDFIEEKEGDADNAAYWLTSKAVAKIARDALPDWERLSNTAIMHHIRNFVRSGIATPLDDTMKSFPHRGKGRSRGLMWNRDVYASGNVEKVGVVTTQNNTFNVNWVGVELW